ncbi:MAG: selenide, water dikinase SelD [Verrucomicrobiales bacterium]|nr:selenide, water dikinase SelD [Verrucomicrobiales bacterium]
MKNAGGPITQELLLLGGGHAHAEVIRSWPMLEVPGTRVTLISRLGTAPYSGMLPGLIAGHYTPEQTHLDLGRLCRHAQIHFVQASIIGLDLEHRRVLCAHRPPLRYDLLSINVGSTPSLDAVPGARAFATPVKPVDSFLAALRRWDAELQDPAGSPEPFRVVIVGGGAGGVELALSLPVRLAGVPQPRRPVEVHLVTASASVPSGHAPAVQRRLRACLIQAGVRVHEAQRVVQVESTQILTQAGLRLPYQALVWATDAAAPPWIRASGLTTDDRGFLLVDDTLRSVSHPHVFGAGDAATQRDSPRPKSGVFAVRQGMPLSRNLAASLRQQPLLPYRPQRRFLSLISTGTHHAVASYGNLACSGRWVWKWKDQIDRRWMAKYQRAAVEAPVSETTPTPPRCGGCGGKLGAEALERALERLPRNPEVPGLLWGTQAREDVAAFQVPADRVLVQSVDFFRALVSDPYLFGRIAANHALGDLHAKGATPHSALATITLPWGSPGIMEEQLFQVLSGAVAQFQIEQVALIGGHTSEGAELGAGFTVNGLADPASLLGKAGARAGDHLILTKALGTGVLMAAEMRGALPARWRDQALAAMLRSNAAAARCLREHGATACTDVTGFGLLGHLDDLLRASQRHARLDTDRIPILEGARELSEAGFQSSLMPDNLARAQKALADADRPEHGSGLDLLVDPQTCGGLLACVPAERGEACLTALHQAGDTSAACIGEIRPAPNDNDREPRIRRR